MKSILVLMALVCSSVIANAYEYECVDLSNTGEAVIAFDKGDQSEEAEYDECFSSNQSSDASVLHLDTSILMNSSMPFVSHQGSGEFDTALAMNVQYEPIKSVKRQIENRLGRRLKIFKGWNPQGEAHVTTITPPEYSLVLRKHISAEKIDQIALEYQIQSSDLEVIGLGKGEAKVDGKSEQTYFVIVRSENLLKIRRAIHRAFVEAGGSTNAWNPEAFYPHITIGFTKRDLHEADGVIKDDQHSLDPRFDLRMFRH